MLSKQLIGLMITLFSFIGIQKIHGQKLIFGVGISAYTDFTISEIEYLNGHVESRTGLNAISVLLPMKYNIAEIGDDLAIALGTSPCLGLGYLVPNGGPLNFRLPFYAQIDYGKLSTDRSRKDIGFGLGIGYQIEKHRLFGKGEQIEIETVVAKFGVHFSNTGSFVFKYAFPKTETIFTGDIIEIGGVNVAEKRPALLTSYQLSLILYLNYRLNK